MAGLRRAFGLAAVLIVVGAVQSSAAAESAPQRQTPQSSTGGHGTAEAALLSKASLKGPLAADKKDAASADPSKTETRMTKEQAKELFKSVDDILAFASKDSKLPIEHTVKRALISRDEVNKFLRQRFEQDESTKRLERSEIVLKKFGLLDRDFHLQTFLVSLLTEQIAGYYDDKTKTVNLLDWIAPDEQKSVLAHELTPRAAGPEGRPFEVGRGRCEGCGEEPRRRCPAHPDG